MRNLILISCLIISSIGSAANQKSPNACIDLLKTKTLLDITLASHFSEDTLAEQNTRIAIKNFIKIIDPLQLTVFKDEYDAYTTLSPENLRKLHAKAVDQLNPDLFAIIANQSLKRITHLILKFSADKAYRQTAISRYTDLKNNPNELHKQSRPQNREDLESKFIDRIVSDMMTYETNSQQTKSQDSKELSPAQLLVLAIRNMRWNLHKTYSDLQPKNLPFIISKAYIESLDPHSDLEIPSDNFHMMEALAGDVVGIGVKFTPDFRGMKIMEVTKGSPASRAGLQKGDVITHISINNSDTPNANDKEKWLLTRNIPIHHAPKYTTGPENSKLEIKLLRNDKTLQFELTRKSVNLTSHHIDIQLHNSPSGVLAHIFIDAFYSGLGEDLRSELESLMKTENISGIALDLRENGGGRMLEIGEVLSLFIKSGPAVYTYSKDGELSTSNIPENSKPIWLGPLVVMTSPMSASASEATAGAFRDYGRALLVGGNTTYGKGSMQETYALNKNKNLMARVTTALFFTPSGTSPQLIGIPSDISLPQPIALNKYPQERKFANAIPPMTLINLPKIDKSPSQINSDLIHLLKENSISRQKNWQIIKDDSEVFERNTEESLNILSDLVTATRSN